MKHKIVIGLGNFPHEYDNTKHNCGFEVVDRFCKENNVKLDHNKFNGLFAQLKCGEDCIFIAKPLTYMNLSGNFVREICSFYKIETDDILIISDDLDTSIGKIRIKTSGSSGGQNGIKSIIEQMGTEKIKRIKIGIGRPVNRGQDISSYVLSKISTQEKQKFDEAFSLAVAATKQFIQGVSFEKIISKFNN